MNENKNEEIIPGLSSKSLKMDLLRFKDDILKDMRNIELRLNKKYFSTEESLKNKINNFELKIGSFEQKILELSNLITVDNSIKEKVELLEQFKEETKDNIFKRRAKYNELEKTINDELGRINNILIDSVIYPGIIGPSAKFKNFHSLIDYLLTEINQLTLIKDRNGLDITPFKKKIEQTIDSFRIQINNLGSKEYVINAINENEKNLKNLIELYDDRLKTIKIENVNNNFNINKKIDELKNQMEIIYNFKNKLELKENEKNIYNNEIKSIKKDINNINEILKQLMLFHIPKNKEIEKKSSQIISGVKQYINGQLNASELSSLKKFTFEKSNSNGRIPDINNHSINTSPFPSPSSFKMKNGIDLNKKKSLISEDLDLFLNKNNNKIIIDNNDNPFFISQKKFNTNKEELLNKYEDQMNNIKKKNEKVNTDFYNMEDNIPIEINKSNNKKINDYKEKEKENIVQDINKNNSQSNEELLNLISFSNIKNEKNILNEEDENNLKYNMKKNNLLNYNNNMRNNIPINNDLIKQKVNSVNKKNNLDNNENNNEKFLNKNNNKKLINNKNKTSRILNISKQNNYYQLFKPYNIELINYTDGNGFGSNEVNVKYNNISFTRDVKSAYKQINNKNDERRTNININKNEKNKSYTNFPKLSKESSEQIIKLQDTKLMRKNHKSNNVLRNINSIGENSNSELKVVSNKKKPKKVLLTSPDNIPLNRIIRKKKKNRSNVFKSEKNMNKQFKKIFDEFGMKKS